MVRRKGIILILSSPSGGGKTTIYKAVLDRMDELTYSVSYTTRSPRAGEVDGRDYSFVSREVFEAMVARKEFIEWAEVHGSFYGTRKATLTETVDKGIDIILDIDVQGARQLRQEIEDAVFLFIFPPSLEVLEQRLRGRKSDSAEIINRRLEIAQHEMADYHQYNYLIINDDIERAISDVMAIIRAERCRVSRLHRDEVDSQFIDSTSITTSR